MSRIKAGMISIFQVSGIKSAMAWTEPMPGSIPTTTPMITPSSMSSRFCHAMMVARADKYVSMRCVLPVRASDDAVVPQDGFQQQTVICRRLEEFVQEYINDQVQGRQADDNGPFIPVVVIITAAHDGAEDPRQIAQEDEGGKAGDEVEEGLFFRREGDGIRLVFIFFQVSFFLDIVFDIVELLGEPALLEGADTPAGKKKIDNPHARQDKPDAAAHDRHKTGLDAVLPAAQQDAKTKQEEGHHDDQFSS